MKSGYKIEWTDHALVELQQTINYLQDNWTDKEIRKFVRELEHTLYLISKNPNLFQVARKGVRRAIIAKYNTLYYRVITDKVEVLAFFSNRQNPDRVKV